jgi:hypothetical protein
LTPSCSDIQITITNVAIVTAATIRIHTVTGAKTRNPMLNNTNILFDTAMAVVLNRIDLCC